MLIWALTNIAQELRYVTNCNWFIVIETYLWLVKIYNVCVAFATRRVLYSVNGKFSQRKCIMSHSF